MSIDQANIRMLRAEGEALTAVAGAELEKANDDVDKSNSVGATMHSTVSLVLVRMSEAKLQAADALERRQRESLGPVGEG